MNVCRLNRPFRALLLVLPWLVCCSGSDELDPDIDSATSSGEVETTVQPPDRVQFNGGETSDFGDGDALACGLWRVTDEAEWRERNPHADKDLELLAQVHSAPLHWLGCHDASSCGPSTIEVMFDVEEYYHLASESGLDEHCESAVGYRAVVRLLTQDHLIAGTFYSDLRAEDASEGRSIQSRSAPDLRNFVGNLELDVDVDTPHYAYLRLSMQIGASGFSGSFSPQVRYTELAAVYDADVRAAWPLPDDGAPESTVYAGIQSLSDYQGSRQAPKFAVGVRATSQGEDGFLPVEVTTWIDDVEQRHGIVESGSFIDLGEFEQGTMVRSLVQSGSDARVATTSIRVANCFSSSGRCEGSGCSAEASLDVYPGACP